MKTDLRIENHDPVPLRPLKDFALREGEPVFIGVLYDKNSTCQAWPPPHFERVELNAWVRLDPNDRWHNVADGDDINRDPCFETSLGRVLQPGEKLIVEYCG